MDQAEYICPYITGSLSFPAYFRTTSRPNSSYLILSTESPSSAPGIHQSDHVVTAPCKCSSVLLARS